MSRQQVLDMTATSVAHARRLIGDVEFSAEDATRTEDDFLAEVIAVAIANGATTINVPDTLGYATPEETRALFQRLISTIPGARDVIFSAHCHNDLGLAVANSLAAIEGGARQVECTINGIGERAGNCAVEELAMALKVRNAFYNLDTQIDTRRLVPTSQLLRRLTGMAVQRNKAIVGENAFAHESGIHQHGMLRHRGTYEIMRPEEVGVPQATLVLGKHSGRHAVQRRCEQLGLPLERHELEQVYWAIMAIADREKVVGDQHLAEVVASLRGRRKATQVSASSNADFSGTPAECGYGHGV
jgi:2-isopropylmalate synthase